MSESTENQIVAGLNKIGLVLKSLTWEQADGLTPTQLQILAILQTSGSKGLSLSAVADGLGVTAATACDTVNVLIRKKLAVKKRSARDGRAVAISLTTTGRRRAQQFVTWPDLLLNSVDALSLKEKQVFLRGMTKMIHSLQQQGRITVARMCATCRHFRPNAYPNPDQPHHCAFMDVPLAEGNLRLDCPEHEILPPAAREEIWNAFIKSTAS